jgi:hypothetical protein
MKKATNFRRGADRFREPSRAASFTRVSMNDERNVRYWTQLLGCSEDELAAAISF